jgi:transcriptional regulator with XRE-family HTH domain
MERREHKNGGGHTPVTLGEYIRQEREKRNMSARRLSQALGMHESYISRVEDGRFKKPSPEKLSRIAKFFNLNYSTLCALAGYRIPGLPGFPGYLRLKYDMSDEDVGRLTKYFELLKAHHGIVEKEDTDSDVTDFELSDEMKQMQGDIDWV